MGNVDNKCNSPRCKNSEEKDRCFEHQHNYYLWCKYCKQESDKRENDKRENEERQKRETEEYWANR